MLEKCHINLTPNDIDTDAVTVVLYIKLKGRKA